ncbi:hypothetical protein ACFY71_39855 [Streptomyces cinerochromogenes]|uniref:hypothetical protein n=1 Tax=Streptomyces cinerochromogenes TaxID=66422 RepID=UPI00367CF44A
MDLDGLPAYPDTEFDDPFRRCRLRAPAALLLGLPLHQLGDLAVYACQPHRVPHPQSAQPLQVRRQIVEHIFDSTSVITSLHSHVRFSVR